MKKIIIASLLIGLVSCQKENTTEPLTINGTWYNNIETKKASISEYISLKDSVHIVTSLSDKKVYKGKVYLLPLGRIFIMNHETEYKFEGNILSYDRMILYR